MIKRRNNRKIPVQIYVRKVNNRTNILCAAINREIYREEKNLAMTFIDLKKVYNRVLRRYCKEF